MDSSIRQLVDLFITVSQKSMNKQGSRNTVPLKNKNIGRLVFVQFSSCLMFGMPFKEKCKSSGFESNTSAFYF